ncbi:glycosyltransferase family 39 protein [Pseudonocardia ailaonensis]|uniref:glycosyltransferase family 39 protein n=1 Tax=Pseudonocardia ailaonensis TaxID=367279 RepID=UPI003CD06D1A
MTSTLTARPADPHVPEDPPRRIGRITERASLAVLLAGTAVLYLWNLSASGWANAFYSAAAQAGGTDWKAWFFGSSDAANSITVDKTPAALWIDGLSVRIFGLNSWAVLVPQALIGVASVWLLYVTVRRTSGHAAGLLAGAVLALTPVAALIFRFNNPDALLVLLLVAAVWATLRGLENGRGRWLVLAGVFLGLGFLTKMLQAFLIVPPLAVIWLVAAPTGIGRRIRDVLAAGVAMVVAAGWWVLVVELWPASSRPYIGGSQNNSVLELVLGYNGFGRITGDETGSVGGGAGGGWGQTGITRLFGSEMGGEASWLLPAALILLVGLLWVTWRRPRTDALRAATVVWGGWLLITGLLFSYMAGIIHPYYTVALAPAIGALAGIGAVEMWRVRSTTAARVYLGLAVAASAVWAAVLLNGWHAWLQWTVLGVGFVAAGGLLGVHRLPRLLSAGVVTAAVLASLGGTAAWSVATAAEAHTGAIPSAGPAGAGRGGFGGGPGRGGFPGGTAGGGFTRGAQGFGGTATTPNGLGQNGSGAGGSTAGGTGGSATGGTGGSATGGAGGSVTGGSATGGTGATGPGTTGQGTGGFGRGGPGGGMGGIGGLLGTSTPSAQVTALLKEDAAKYTWVAAAVGSNTAAGYQLAADAPVMAVGGFNGTDPSPTLVQFQQDVAEGKIHWFVGGAGADRGGSDTGGSDEAARIAQWVQSTFTATTVDGVTLYDLASGTTA